MKRVSAIRRGIFTPLLLAGLACSGATLATGSLAAQANEEANAQAVTPSSTQESDVAAYCRNTADAAAEARIAWQTWKLLALQDSLKLQLEALEEKRARFEEWVERRNKILSAVEDHVVSIYGRMRPDAAASQLATLDEDIAVGVLSKLKPREASAILNEMDPVRGAQLAQSISSLSSSRIGEGS
ncbi:MotE family protein [Breoghania sp.]|uniref:MotE family protein n=1 Tax=Breoghania sp. TaxID=2065378 RepID=UPI002AABF4C2|nr:MotE family protein [Breoghania sp.]